MATSIGPTYDPQTTATALAQKFIEPQQQLITAKTSYTKAVQKGLADLKAAILEYQTSLSSLTGLNKTLFAQSAVLSDTTLGSATATAKAASGTYSFFVEKVATAGQISYDNVPSDTAVTSVKTLGIKLGGALAFTVDLSAADTDGTPDGKISVREIAAAINKNAANASRVSASVITVGTSQQLVLTALNTGTTNQPSLDLTNLAAVPASPPTALITALSDHPPVVTAVDAIVWIGEQGTGTKVTQASNTFTNVDGLKVTFTKAQAAGAQSVKVTVAADTAASTKNVQDFVAAYNKLKGAVDKLVDAGDPNKGVAGGVFAHDAGMRALRDRLVDLMRPAASTSLAAYGITGDKQGLLVVKEADLLEKLAADPTGLDTLIGSTAAHTGIADKLDTFLKVWSNTTNGKIKERSSNNERLQKDLEKRQTRLDSQYDSAYQRYLMQFTKLQTLQSQMSSNVSMFDALFGSDKSK